MSCIEKMTIQGIRSYGPKDKHTQVIEFFFPVTLIVGQNGCGKTTVIECLKFATTSDMPPNTKGVSFVFDPKLIDEVEVKGRVNLYFRDTSGLCVQVTKNLCVTQKAKKLEFRTAETIISRYSRENKLLSTITSKCINADAEVVNAFGVSKAVLEHVIFCHQEDSNWPLSEGKVLKTRFDEIFAATKYIKALDTLRKQRLEISGQIKLKDQEKKFLQGSKDRADSLKRELGEQTHIFESLKQRQESVSEKLRPIQKQLDAYFLQSNKIVEIKGQLDKVENEKSLLEKQIKELLVLTKHCMFTGTDEELREHVQEYTSTTDKMRFEEEKTINKKLEAMTLQLKELNGKRSRFIIEIGSLENKQKIYNQNREKLLQLLKAACTKIDADYDQFEDLKGSCDDQKLTDDFMQEMKEFIQQYVGETEALEGDYMSKNKELELRLDAERDRKSKLDQSAETKREVIEKNARQLEQIQNDLKFIATDSVMDKLTSEIEQCDNELEYKLMDMTDVKLIKKELDTCESKRTSLRKEESLIDARLTKLHADSKAQTEIDLLKADKSSKEDQIKKIRQRIDEELGLFFDVENNEDLIGDLKHDLRLKDLYETRLRDVKSELNALELKNKEIEKRQCSSEMKRKAVYDELRTKETLLRQYEDQLTTQLNDCITCPDDIEQFDSILEKLQEEHKANMDENGFLNGVDKTYKRFLAQLQETTTSSGSSRLSLKAGGSECPSCPVCMRDFKDSSELDETITELKRYSKNLPKKMEIVDVKIKETEAKVQAMINMKPTKESYKRLKDTELVELKSQMDSIDRHVMPKIKKELKENVEAMRKLEELKGFSESIQSEIVIIDKYANEVSALQRKIEQQSLNFGNSNESDDSCGDVAGETALERVQNKKLIIQDEIQLLIKQIQSYQADINKSYKDQDAINVLKEKLNALKTKRNELQAKMQRKTQLSEKQTELTDEIDATKEEIKSIGVQLKALISSIEELNQLKNTNSEEQRKVLSERNRFLNELKACEGTLTELIGAIRVYERTESFKLSETKKSIKEVDEEEADLQGQIDSHRQKLEDIKMELARHEIKQRELTDNLALRDKRQEWEAKKKAYLAVKGKLDEIDANFNLKTFKAEKEMAERNQAELMRELNEIQTKMNVTEGRMQATTEELESDAYKNSFEKWADCASDLRVLELAVTDIERYYKALDKAVMSYHLSKMNEINKTIKQLWRQVYRGTDIDYIEIRSEEDTGDSEVQLKARRVYNYRVVLIKNDCALDMRGRCSAGQKVLASIIIRLALSEVFCLNSGILALDEPTTNLDRENIESLSSALVEIIKDRSKQKNFQLIIITHDEDFLDMLGRSEYLNEFYRVKKDENGFSKISRRSNIDYQED